MAKTFCLPEKHAFIVCKAFKPIHILKILFASCRLNENTCGLVKVVTLTKIIFVFCFVSLHKSAFCFNDSGGPD